MPDPKSGVAYNFDLTLFLNGQIVMSPTLAAGDVTVLTDETSSGNINTLPTVSPAASGNVFCSLDATEMTGARVKVTFIDQTSPKAWDDTTVVITTTTQTVDDLATQASVNTIDDFLDTEIAVILAAVDTEVAAILAAVTDAIPELGVGAPPATPTPRQAWMLLYMALRNRVDVDAGTLFKKIYNDAGAVVAKKALSDTGAGGVYSEAEMETGP